ncbi:MAG: class I SAM-dependent methyltransferase [Bacteroidia bacterium]|nr:class I SAM-dependent methyltransferase [Bacteroidia bacterium]
MKVIYDKHYQKENLFGEAYPELIEFFTQFPKKGKVLDLGCGQGRDAIALARLGYSVIGIDNSKVGIEQMNQVAQDENLDLIGKVADIYAFDNFDQFDIVLLDSMFHFTKKDKEKEINLVQKIISKIKFGCLLVFCIQDIGNKIKILNQIVDSEKQLNRLVDKKFKYYFEDSETGHQSESDYRMIVIEKDKI